MIDDRVYIYRDFVRTASQRFEHRLNEIEVVHKFDYGDEFEIAICHTLRQVLPQQFGVCRGHVVNRAGDEAGDDIIIFDRMLYPTLRLLPMDDYSRKEWIPIEGVYAYIEAKHSLRFVSKDNVAGGGSTIDKAIKQVHLVKELCDQRAPTWEKVSTDPFGLSTSYSQANRLYAMIFARHVRLDNAIVKSPSVIEGLLQPFISENSRTMPDLMVAGNSNLVFPGREIWISGMPHLGIFNDGEFRSGQNSKLHQVTVPEIAFGTALCMLLCALSNIQLGEISMVDIVNDALSPKPTVAPHIDRNPPSDNKQKGHQVF